MYNGVLRVVRAAGPCGYTPLAMRALKWTAAVLALLVLGAGGWAYLEWTKASPLPPDLAGTVVYVSDRSGMSALYLRRFPKGEETRLTVQPEAVRDPALSPDGRRVAFSMGGRIGVARLDTGDVGILTFGVDWRDASPAWQPDGKGLVVCSRRTQGDNGDIHRLLVGDAESGATGVVRRPLTSTNGLDEHSPAVSPDGAFVVFVRDETIYRLDVESRATKRLTGGFRRTRAPRFLPSGRLVFLWSLDKDYGIDVMDADGKGRETLSQGPVFYRTVAPSPDGRYLAATFSFDLGFHPAEALKLRQTEEVRLLDSRGGPLAALARSWRHSNHSPDWGR